MRRLTVYLPEVLCDAIAAHADAAGQKLSTFVARRLMPLMDEPVVDSAGVKALKQFAAERGIDASDPLGIAEANAKAAGR